MIESGAGTGPASPGLFFLLQACSLPVMGNTLLGHFGLVSRTGNLQNVSSFVMNTWCFPKQLSDFTFTPYIHGFKRILNLVCVTGWVGIDFKKDKVNPVVDS